MSSTTKEVFGGKSFADLLKDIYDISTHKRKQIEILINELRPLITQINEAAVIVPLIKDYLEVGVRNDDQLAKIAAIFQKYMASEDRVNNFNTAAGGGGVLTDAEKEQLLNEVSEELLKEENIVSTSKSIDMDFDELLKKTKSIQSETSGSGAK